MRDHYGIRKQDLSGIIFEANEISQEVAKAQRMAEFAQMSEYRRLRLQEYIDWSDPVKRQAKIDAAKIELCEGKAKFNKSDDPELFKHISVRKKWAPPAERIFVDYHGKRLPPHYEESPYKREPYGFVDKKSLWQRLKAWFKRG